jgi:phage terminase small subunit
MANKLTPKQSLFVKYYLSNGYNGTKAALKAGYSKRCAPKIASENLLKDIIKEEIEEEKRKLGERTEITRDRLLHDLDRIRNNTEKDNPQAALKSIDLMIKMLGFNEPVKSETKITTEVDMRDLLDFDEDEDEKVDE